MNQRATLLNSVNFNLKVSLLIIYWQWFSCWFIRWRVNLVAIHISYKSIFYFLVSNTSTFELIFQIFFREYQSYSLLNLS